MSEKNELMEKPEKRPQGWNLKGRQKGVKNKTTLFKEAVRGQFEELLIKDARKVYEVVVDEAIKGNMKAAKILIDRMIPVAKAVDLDELEKSRGLSISINIGSLEEQKEIGDTDGVIYEHE